MPVTATHIGDSNPQNEQFMLGALKKVRPEANCFKGLTFIEIRTLLILLDILFFHWHIGVSTPFVD